MPCYSCDGLAGDVLYYIKNEEQEARCQDTRSQETWRLENDTEMEFYSLATDGIHLVTCVLWDDYQSLWQIVYDAAGRPESLILLDKDLQESAKRRPVCRLLLISCHIVQKSERFFCNPVQTAKKGISIDGFQQKCYNLKEYFRIFLLNGKHVSKPSKTVRQNRNDGGKNTDRHRANGSKPAWENLCRRRG